MPSAGVPNLGPAEGRRLLSRGASERAINTALVASLVLVVIVAVQLVQAVRHPVSRPSARPAPRLVTGWQRFSQDSTAAAADLARVSMVVFSDYQCPFCRALDLKVDTLLSERSDVRVEVRHFPLVGSHPHAFGAAIAAVCAGFQGRFTAMHNLLLREQSALGGIGWSEFGERAGVRDARAFDSCLQGPDARAVVDADTAAGHLLGVRLTPSFLVNEMLYTGDYDLDSLRHFVEEAKKRARARVADGRRGGV